MISRIFWVPVAWVSLLLIFFSVNATANIVVVNGLTHEYKASAGETYRGQIEVQNNSSKSQYVKIYQRDYLFFYTGEILYNDPGSIDRSNANWITLSSNYVKVGAGEQLSLQYEVVVPENDSLLGSYWSLIMVEGVDDIDTNNISEGISIQSVMRYAIQIITNINETGLRRLEFINVKLLKEDSTRFLRVDLKNTGERFMSPVLKLELFDPKGNSVAVFEATKRKIYPGTSTRSRVIIENVPPGLYQALLVADNGDEDVFGLNLSLELEDD
jgi:hypothetical protein